VKLSDRHTFIVVQREPVTNRQRVRFVDGLHQALGEWHPTTCLSPVFRLLTGYTGGVDPGGQGSYELLFVGPISPFPFLTTLNLDSPVCGLAIWLSLGAHNFVVGGSNLTDVLALVPSGTSYEYWRLEDGLVTDPPQFEEPPLLHASQLGALTSTATELASPNAPVLLRNPALEYCSLMATTLQRASICLPELLPDLQRANQEILEDVSEAIRATDIADIAIEAGALTNSNLALARLASQALSSFAPLVDGEADLKMHSLLGVGIANLALQRLRRFVEKQLGREDLPGRIRTLEDDEGHIDLCGIRCSDPFWERDILAEKSVPPSSQPFPLITYFSDTDHYKSTLTTLSAPTTAIGSCNTFQWSLLTLTHEICHTLVRGILPLLLPPVDDEQALIHAIDIIEDPGNASSLLDQSRRLLLTSILAMDCSPQLSAPFTTAFTPQKLADVITKWHHEAEELLVHLLDFMYFYDSDDQKYVPWIWLSWGVIPNIGNRVLEYIQRTLCVLLSKNLYRGHSAEIAAKDQLLLLLNNLQSEMPSSHIKRALELFDARWERELYYGLIARKGLVKLAKGILHSPKLAGPLLRDRSAYAPGSDRGGYNATAKVLTDLSIYNPLKFLKSYTRDYEPSGATSAWMLTTIAFNSADNW
jgi:hypothetical protein